MWCLKQHSKDKAFVEEPKDYSMRSSGGALACMVNSEIAAVLAVMRRNVRWGVHYITDNDQLEHALIQSFNELRRKLFLWQHQWHTISPVMYLQPFLDVIRSDETGAPITGVALSSIYKFLTLEILDLDSVNVADALHLIVDSVTSCRFEVTDPASEEVVLMKILQVLLACMKSRASVKLSNQHVCNIVNTCFRVVHQASSKGELLQRIARHTMHELVRCIFSHLPDIDSMENTVAQGGRPYVNKEVVAAESNLISGSRQQENDYVNSEYDGQPHSASVASTVEEYIIEVGQGEAAQNGGHLMMEPYGVPCMDELFCNLMQFGFSMSPLIFSTVCSIVLNLYYHLRTKLKLQLEAFLSCVLLRIAQSKHDTSYQQQEVAMETLVDLCRQQMFVTEMYANFDCNISCSNVFEDLVNLLSKSAFPVNNPLSSMHILAMDGLITMVKDMAGRVRNEPSPSEQALLDLDKYKSFWMAKCENYDDPAHWVPFVQKLKYIKRRLMIGVDHFNRDPKKGLEFLQGMHLLPEKLEPQSVACFLRYTNGLDKNLIGDFLGNHDEFCVQVLYEFAGTFDFRDMNLDTALRVFLETFRLPGESQKIQRVLEAFAGRYHEQSPRILVNKDAALLLSYSLILLNTDQHNVQVKKKMTEGDFIRNNRHINGGDDLPRDYLSELYHSICENEIRMTPEQGSGFPIITPNHWIGLMHRSKQAAPFIISDSRAHLDYDIFRIVSGPSIAAISVVFDNVEQEDILQTCVDGFLAIAKISACYHLDDVLDSLVISLCKFTTLLHPFSVEESIVAFADDIKARMATVIVFTIANRHGDYIRSSWKNIMDCVISLHKLGLLSSPLVNDTAGDLEPSDWERGRPATSFSAVSQLPSVVTPRKSSGLMGRFSQFLYLDAEELEPQPTEEQLAAHQRTLQTIQNCHIDSIFAESKFLQAESLTQLSQALILAAGQPRKGTNFLEDEDTGIFCLELLIAITLNNRDRIMLLWMAVYEHISSIVQSTSMPCALVEKAVFGLLRICQRLLPYKENLTDELLKSLQLILKLDARVADAYCEHITHEVMRLVKANAIQIRSHMGWRTIASLLSITARHPEASEAGFETLVFIMSDGACLLPANYVLCVNSARQFAESRVGNIDRSVRSLDLMAGSIACLTRWSCETKEAVGEEAALKMYQDIWEMWLRLVQGLRKVCLDQREEVRNHALLLLLRCLTGVDGIHLSNEVWFQCFDMVIFTLLDDLVEIAQEKSPKDYWNMEGTLALSMKLLSKVFLQLLHDLSQFTSFCKLWLGILNRMERFMKVKFRGKLSEKIRELVPELLKNTLFVMKARGILVQSDGIAGDSFWQLTWLHVKNISPMMQSEVFTDNELEQLKTKHIETVTGPMNEGNVFVPPSETMA